MNIRLMIALAGSLIAVTAHGHSHHNLDHLSKEKLLEVIVILAEQKAMLKAELAKAEYKLEKEHRVHALEKDLENYTRC